MIIGSNILFIPDLPSTNSFAAQTLKDGRPGEGTVIRTNYQSAGRGHGTSGWESEADKNLLISIILYPHTISPEDQFLLSMMISLGIHDFLSSHLNGVKIKWPNDIYVKDDKIAGILIENGIMGNRIEHTVAGIGLNINQEIFLSDAPNPVSMKMLTGKEYITDECLLQLLSCLDRRYKAALAPGGVGIPAEYNSLLYGKDEWRKYSDEEGSFTGRLLNAGPDGRARIERETGGLKEYSFKELEFS
jgi:BirA family biotin operon repressor/biotin-[acetyl-CoA-carboxylase] ligase